VTAGATTTRRTTSDVDPQQATNYIMAPTVHRAVSKYSAMNGRCHLCQLLTDVAHTLLLSKVQLRQLPSGLVVTLHCPTAILQSCRRRRRCCCCCCWGVGVIRSSQTSEQTSWSRRLVVRQNDVTARICLRISHQQSGAAGTALLAAAAAKQMRLRRGRRRRCPANRFIASYLHQASHSLSAAARSFVVYGCAYLSLPAVSAVRSGCEMRNNRMEIMCFRFRCLLTVKCLYFLPPPRRLRFHRRLFVCLLAGLRKNYLTDFHSLKIRWKVGT